MVSGIEGIAGVAVQRCLRRGELKVVPRHPSTERPWLTVKFALAALAKHRATVHALCDHLAFDDDARLGTVWLRMRRPLIWAALTIRPRLVVS